MLVARQILIERGTCSHSGFLQFNDHQWQAIYETNEVRTTGVECTRDTELTHQNEFVVGRVLPVNDTQSFGLLSPVHFVRHRDFDSLF